ncbi:MAG: hypothetical protein ACRC5M_03255 [Anaeroplasmataceae bacterium]
MKFKFYFLKEDKRDYDKADLLELLYSNKYITVSENKDGLNKGPEYICEYKNDSLNSSCNLILDTKSVIPNIHKIDPKYLDVKIRLEVDVLSNEYFLDKVLDLIEVMCRRFQFVVFNEIFDQPIPFKRATMLKSFEIIKATYKKENEEEFRNYYKLEKNVLAAVYDYFDNEDHLNSIYANFDTRVLPITFHRVNGSRSCYVCSTWDGESNFILLSNSHIFQYKDNSLIKYIEFKEMFDKIKKYLILVQDTDVLGLYRLNPKYKKKVKKIIQKTKFSPNTLEFLNVDIKDVIDI